MVPKVVRRSPLLRADEVLELHRVPDEEHRRVVADQIEVAVAGVELHREAARVPPSIRAAALPGHGGKPNQHNGTGARRTHRRTRVRADILRDLESAERAASLRVRL